MATDETPAPDVAPEAPKARSRSWVKPTLITLGILGGLALHALLMGLAFRFSVTVPTLRALERARVSIEANSTARAKELEEALHALAAKPTPPPEAAEVPEAAPEPTPAPAPAKPAPAKPAPAKPAPAKPAPAAAPPVAPSQARPRPQPKATEPNHPPADPNR